MEEFEQLSIDERIENLQAIIAIAEYEISVLLKQKEYKPIWFIFWQKKEWLIENIKKKK